MTDRPNCLVMLDALCPMHLVVSGEGIIISAGPTLQKISAASLLGAHFLECFEIKRPRAISNFKDLKTCVDGKLSLRFREPPCRQLKGLLVHGPEDGQVTINLSFGISVVDAVQVFNLTAADFAATDLAVEMLYLVEAKSAAMQASRLLNEKLEVAREAAEELASKDTLTGLMNRRAMDNKLASLISNHNEFALMHIDLDFFKQVNDTLGHAAGDGVLQRVSALMKSNTRATDLVARVGGDEFVVLLPGCPQETTLSEIAEHLIKDIQKPMRLAAGVCTISCSVGIVRSQHYPQPDAEKMLADADVALYAAKNAGRGRYLFYSKQLRNNTAIGAAAT